MVPVSRFTLVEMFILQSDQDTYFNINGMRELQRK